MENAHISALEAKHSGIDQRLTDEIRRPLPDMSLVTTLKKQKLRIKESMTALMR